MEAVIAEMDYRMNVLGRNLRTSESRLLLTMVPDIDNPFYAEIVRGIEGIAREHGYNVLLCDTGSSPADERPYLDMLYNKLADGAICLDPEATQATTAAETGSLNWVACCEFDPDGHVPYVGIDNRAAAFDAVSCLISKGRRRIAIINSDERYMYARMRRQGYLDALTRAGLSAPEGCLIHAPGITFDDGRAAARQLMALATLPFPRTHEALARIAANIAATQDALGRTIAIENPTHYLHIEGHDWSETDFLAGLVRRTGCSLLLDVNNVVLSAHNLGTSAHDYLDAFPVQAITEIHLAGHHADPRLGEALLIDSHDAPVAEPVWALYEHLIARTGPRPTLIERDDAIPPLPELLAERERAHHMLANLEALPCT